MDKTIVKAVKEYREGRAEEQDRALSRAFERLEPCAVKVARTVLRGGSGGNIASLPDIIVRSDYVICYLVGAG